MIKLIWTGLNDTVKNFRNESCLYPTRNGLVRLLKQLVKIRKKQKQISKQYKGKSVISRIVNLFLLWIDSVAGEWKWLA